MMTSCDTIIKELINKTKETINLIDTKINKYGEYYTEGQINKLKNFKNELIYTKYDLEENAKNLDVSKLSDLEMKINGLDSEVRKVNYIKPSTNTTNSNQEKNYKYQYEEESKKNNKGSKIKKIALYTLIAALIAKGSYDIAKFDEAKKNNQTDDNNFISYGINNTINGIKNLFKSGINLNSQTSIDSAVDAIQKTIPELSDEEIKDAVRLCNFNVLTDKNIFENKNDVLHAMMTTGKIANVCGYDALVNRHNVANYFIENNVFEYMLKNVCNLSIDEFIDAKTKNGYDIYKVLDIIVKGLNGIDQTQYAKLMNEIVTDATNNFTILEKAPNETIYAVLATYNANRKTIVNLTHGHNWGPIYGFGVDMNNQVLIDGTYGNICGEEIDKFVRCTGEKGNYKATDNNAFYGPILDNEMLSQGYTR